MTRYGWRARVFAACLSGLAGYVDAIGFLALGGFFVSFMSGNSTRLSVAVADGNPDAARALLLIVLFVLGVIAASLIGSRLQRHRARAILLIVAALLAASPFVAAAGWTVAALGLVAVAMGAENTIFERDGEVSIGLTYMTGTLVRLGQRIALALRGGDRLAWLPFLLLWLGLVAGAVLGALAYQALGITALWVAAAAAALLAVFSPHPALPMGAA